MLSLFFSLYNKASKQRVLGKIAIHFDLINLSFEIPFYIYLKTLAQPLALFHLRV